MTQDLQSSAGAKTLEILDRLISFDTTSHKSNLALMDYVGDYLGALGVEHLLVHNDEKTKANLYATIGPDIEGGIVLSGHTDVVPIDGQDWSSDPFTVTKRDGRLFGRGTSDMKSFIAAALAAVPAFVEKPLRTPIHLAFSYDEEVGCLGVRPLIKKIEQDLPRPSLVIVGEPTSMRVVNAHKGIRSFRTTVTGLEAHSSNTHLGVNAISIAARLMGFLDDIAAEMRERGDPTGRFEPNYTTLNLGRITGGTAINIIPRLCKFGWEHRALPSQDPDEIKNRLDQFANEKLLPQMHQIDPETNIETRIIGDVPGLNGIEGSPAETLVLALAEKNEVHAVSYTTEAGLFDLAGIPAIVCGPGDIAQAHKPDEFIDLSQIDLCLRFMSRLVDHVRDQ